MSEAAPSYYGTTRPYFDALNEVLWAAGIYAEQGRGYTDVGDVAGAAYAIRCLVANTRSAVAIMGHLREMADRQAGPEARAEKAFTTMERAR